MMKFSVKNTLTPFYVTISTALLISIVDQAFAQKVTISGYVKDSATKESLIGANVYEVHLQKGGSTNQYGFYSITLPSTDTLEVVFSYIGYRPEVRKLLPLQNFRLDILLTSANVLTRLKLTLPAMNRKKFGRSI